MRTARAAQAEPGVRLAASATRASERNTEANDRPRRLRRADRTPGSEPTDRHRGALSGSRQTSGGLRALWSISDFVGLEGADPAPSGGLYNITRRKRPRRPAPSPPTQVSLPRHMNKAP